MKRAIKILSFVILLTLLVTVIAIVWFIPNYTIRINSKFNNIFLTDHSSDKLLKPEDFGIPKSSVEYFSTHTPDGLKISALRVLHEDSADRRGAIIFLHGIRRSKECSFPMASFFSKKGYDCYAMDLRSHGESSGEYITYGESEHDDLSSFIDYISENFGLDERVILWGQSLGAAVAFLTAEYDSRVDVLISESTYSEFERSVGDFFSFFTGFNSPFIERIIVKRISSIAKFRPDDISPLNAAKNIDIPVMIVHGHKDNKISPVNAYELFYGLLSGNKRFLILPDASHLDVWDKGGNEYFAEVEKFLNTKLNGKKQPFSLRP